LLINGFLQKYLSGKKIEESKIDNQMAEKTVKVSGMTCNHCKTNVQNNLSSIEGIENIDIDLDSGKVKMTGDDIDLSAVKSKVESIGYEYGGEV